MLAPSRSRTPGTTVTVASFRTWRDWRRYRRPAPLVEEDVYWVSVGVKAFEAVYQGRRRFLDAKVLRVYELFREYDARPYFQHPHVWRLLVAAPVTGAVVRARICSNAGERTAAGETCGGFLYMAF